MNTGFAKWKWCFRKLIGRSEYAWWALVIQKAGDPGRCKALNNNGSNRERMREIVRRKDENHFEQLDVRLGNQRQTPLRTACRIVNS